MTNEARLRQEELVSQQDAQPMPRTQIKELEAQTFGWDIAEQNPQIPHLVRKFKFGDFKDAITFTQRVGDLAEKANHHPRITIEWGRVTVEWWSHEVGGLHRNDFIMAARTNDIYDRWSEIVGEKDEVDQALESTFPASDPPAVGSRIE